MSKPTSVRIINPKVGLIWCGAVLIFVIAPLFIVLAVSLSAAKFTSFPWDQGFTLDWYLEIPLDMELLEASWHSLQISFGAALVATLVGTLGALALVRHDFLGKGVISLLGGSPLFVPQVMTGLALVIGLAASGVASGFWILIIGHIVITLPYVLRTVSSTLVGLNLNLEWAAMNLGATRLQTARLVLLPQILPGVLSGAMMAVIVSLENVSLSIFLAGPSYDILPVWLYNYASNQFDGFAASVSVAMVILSLAGVGIVQKSVGLERIFGADFH